MNTRETEQAHNNNNKKSLTRNLETSHQEQVQVALALNLPNLKDLAPIIYKLIKTGSKRNISKLLYTKTVQVVIRKNTRKPNVTPKKNINYT